MPKDIRWVEHVWRAVGELKREFIMRICLASEPDKKKRRGAMKLDRIKFPGLKLLESSRNLKRLAVDRNAWRGVVKAGMGLQGLN